MTKPFPERCNCGALDCPHCHPDEWNRQFAGEERTPCSGCGGEKFIEYEYRTGSMYLRRCPDCQGRGWVPVVGEVE